MGTAPVTAISAFTLLWACAAQAGAPPVREIVFEGNDITRAETMLREMSVHTGDPADAAQIERSRQAVQDLGLFRPVDAEQRVLDDGVQLTFRVREKYYLVPSPRADYNSDGQYSYGVQLRWNNVWGLNHRLRSTVKYKNRQEAERGTALVLSAGYTAPLLWNSPYSLDLSGSYSTEPVESIAPYEELSSALRFTLTRAFWNDGPLSQGFGAGAGAQWQEITTDGPDAPPSRGHALALLVNGGYDRMHNHLYSESGQRLGAELQSASTALGSDYAYTALSAQYDGSWRVGEAAHQTLGVFALAGTHHGATVSGEPPFSLGGADSLRGYRHQVLRGDGFYYGGVEFLRPVGREWLRGMVFIEGGGVSGGGADALFWRGLPVSAVFPAPAWEQTRAVHLNWRQALRAAGPLAAPLVFLLLGLLWLSATRLGLVLWQWPRLADVPDLFRLFTLGARLDLMLLCYLLALPVLVQVLLPRCGLRRALCAALLTVATLALLVMELLTPPFMAQFDHRPDRIFYEYLIYPREVFGMLFKTYPALGFGLPPLACLALVLFWRRWRRALARERTWPYLAQLAVLPVVLPLLLLGARGMDHRPLNISHASFSDNRLANQLALNSSYSAAYAAYSEGKEIDAARLYGEMPWPEVLIRVRKYMNVPESAFTDPQIPTLHRQAAAAPRQRPLNLVIILEESLGAGHVGHLGGLPLTPNLDALTREGLWFSKMYATGTRTARGMEAVAAGFPPTPAQPVLKLPRAQNGFFTLGGLLSQHGYATEFIYGGVANFDNMRGFYLNNGFDRVIEQRDFKNPVLLGSWGVSDEDWAAKAHETFVAHGDKPFFALMMSTSNHEPFEFPENRIEPYEQPLHTRANAVKYADYAIGEFFKLARGADYFKNTVFVVLADHEARVYGAEAVPVKHFRVPMVILGPGVPVRSFDQIASQIDLAPTLLGLLGLSTEHPMIGRDLLAPSLPNEGRALMQFEAQHGFRWKDRLVVHAPHEAARTFAVDASDGLTPVANDPELVRDALAHALWASHSYRQELYRLPAEPAPAYAAAAPSASAGDLSLFQKRLPPLIP